MYLFYKPQPNNEQQSHYMQKNNLTVPEKKNCLVFVVRFARQLSSDPGEDRNIFQSRGNSFVALLLAQGPSDMCVALSVTHFCAYITLCVTRNTFIFSEGPLPAWC